jgi:hypothetical protein
MLLVFSIISLQFIWNFIWLLINNEYVVLYILDFLINKTLYYIVIVACPLDICKMYMLKENKRIFALLLCFIGTIKLGLEGLIFDELVDHL